MKKINISKIIFIFIFMMLIIFILSNKVEARSYTIENMDFQVTVKDNGDLDVTQTLKYKFNGEYNGIYITIPINFNEQEYDKLRENNTVLKDSLYNCKGAEIVSVKQGANEYKQTNYATNGQTGLYTADINGSILTLKIFSPSNNITKDFTINYILKNVAVRHKDVGEVYYNFIGGKWDVVINNLNIDIYLPKNTTEDIYVWGHGPYNGQSKIVNKNKVNLKCKDIKKGKYVAARVVFNLNNIPNSTKTTNEEALNIILTEEKDIAKNISKKESFTTKIIIVALILLIYWAILIFKYESDKKQYIDSKDDEMFQKYNPLIAGCIQGGREILSRDIISVLLNLVNKRKCELEIIPDANEKDGYKYFLKKNPKSEYEMDEIEEYIYNWFFSTMDKIELKGTLNNLPQKTTSKDKFKKLNYIVNNKMNDLGANSKRVPKLLRILNTLIFGVCLCLIGVHLLYNVANIYNMEVNIKLVLGVIAICLMMLPLTLAILYIPLFIISKIKRGVNKMTQNVENQKLVSTTLTIILIALILMITTAILSKKLFLIADEFLFFTGLLIMLTDNLMMKNNYKIMEDYCRLNSLKYNIENYSLTNMRDFKEIVLWENYLTYGISFGIASKIIKQIKEIYIDEGILTIFKDRDFVNIIDNNYYDFYVHANLDNNYLKKYEKFTGESFKAMASTGDRRRRRIFWRWRIFWWPEVAAGGGGAF